MNRNSNSEHNDALDGLRGFAALVVLFGHAAGNFGVNDGSLRVAARSGVYVFFVLSAYLLTKQFLDSRPSKASLPSYLNNYLYRRVARILPLYLLATTVYYSVTLFFPSSGCVIFNFQQYIDAIILREARGHFWTIPVEFFFYFILPVFALLAIDLSIRLYSLISVSVFILFELFVTRSDGDFIPNIYLFLPGVYAAKLVSDYNFSRVQKLIFQILGWLSLGAFLFLTPILERALGYNYHEVENMSTWSILSFFILITLAIDKRGLAYIFKFTLLRFIGRISYSIYLWHILAYAILDRAIPDMSNGYIRFSIVLCCLTIFSYFSWLWLEMPLYRSKWLRNQWRVTVGRWL